MSSPGHSLSEFSFDTDQHCAMEMADRVIKYKEDFAGLALGNAVMESPATEHSTIRNELPPSPVVPSPVVPENVASLLPVVSALEVDSVIHIPKRKRTYTKRKSFSQPLASIDENTVNCTLSSPVGASTIANMFSCPPFKPRKKPALSGIVDGAPQSTSVVVGKGGRGRGGRGLQRKSIPRPLWEGKQEPTDMQPAELNVTPAAKPETVSIADAFPVGLQDLDGCLQSVKEVIESKLSPALDAPISPIAHRPLTRSLSVFRKVLVSIDNFQDVSRLQLPFPGAEYVVGQLAGEFYCTILKKQMVLVSLIGFEDPVEFFAHSVHVFPEAPILASKDYTSPCVCCLPEGEAKLPSDSEKGDSDYSCSADLMDHEMEEDKTWADVVAEDPGDLNLAEEYFRYKSTLPFETKYHDLHWHREYRGEFGTERKWLGGEEVGIPEMEKTSSPVQILDKFITKDTWVRIVKQTNLYAKQKRRKEWRPLTVVEFKAWLGICVFMGILKLPELAMHWKQDHPVFRNNFIPFLMPRDRWLDIMACVHLVDNKTLKTDKSDPAYDKIAKLRWLLDEVCVRFRLFKPVDRFLSIDEMMILCLSKYCPIKQYNKDKPVPHGIKVWALVSASSKYIYHLSVYTGAESGARQSASAMPACNQSLEDRPTYRVVMNLMSHVPNNMGHVVTMDNFFTSVKVFADLLDRGIYATGTARPNMVGWPSSINWNKKSKGSRGQLRWRMHSSLELGACVWYDKRPVGILSSFALPWKEDTWVSRKEGAQVVIYPTSPSLLSYVKLMRGVDVADQLRGGYSISRKGRRWWKRGLFFIFDSVFCNCWVIARDMWSDCPRESHPFHNHVSFNIALGDALVKDWIALKGLQSSIDGGSISAGVAHGPVWTNNIRKNCRVCGKRCRWMCATCPGEPHMCIARDKTCYQIFHQRQKMFV